MTALFKKLAGTSVGQFAIGLAGIILKSTGVDVAQVRNNDDSGFARLQGATPTGDSDFATKLYVDSKETTIGWRLKMSQALFQMATIAELSKLQREQQEATPEVVIERLHADRELIPVLRKWVASGKLTLDDIDPPGERLTG